MTPVSAHRPATGGAARILSAAFAVFLVFAIAGGAYGASREIGVVVSRRIRPYIEAVRGIGESLESGGVALRTVFLEDGTEPASEKIYEELETELIIGVGPEAALELSNPRHGWDGLFLYTMVLNPEVLLDGKPADCGVPLNIPVHRQVKEIAGRLPGLRRIGLLFDPEYNQGFFHEAEAVGKKIGQTIIPLKVDSKADIPEVLRNQWGRVDAIWMIPDRTVISESIVQYVIKQALLKNIPVIGYNRFFLESGATLAFVIDYAEIGRQAGRLALEVLGGAPCRRAAPDFEAFLNERVLERLGITVAEPPSGEVGSPVP